MHSMSPEKLGADALRLFNSLPAETQRAALKLCAEHGEETAVYLAAMRQMHPDDRRRLLFSLSRRRWRL